MMPVTELNFAEYSWVTIQTVDGSRLRYVNDNPLKLETPSGQAKIAAKSLWVKKERAAVIEVVIERLLAAGFALVPLKGQ